MKSRIGALLAAVFLAGQATPLLAADLDLTSTARSSVSQHSAPAAINVGGAVRMVRPGDALTAAESVALQQVLTGGNQSLLLNGGGAAIGGQLSTSTYTGGSAGNVVIPQGVTAVHDFGANSTLNLTGNLVNSGALFAFSSAANVATATISASNILNQSGAIISSAVPANVHVASAVSNLNLSLSALQDIVNAGTVGSAGRLNLSAGGKVVNSAVVQSAGNLNVNTNHLVNTGVMHAPNHNINIAAEVAHDLSIEGGGDYVSNQLNMSAPEGTIEANLGNVTGVMNQTAREAHVFAQSDTLRLGEIKMDGDPTYYNIGPIQINGDISVAERLTILSTGNITSTLAATAITARDGGGQGYDIHIVAGANLAPACGTCYPTLSGSPASSGAVTLTPAGGAGGNVDFSASPNLQINANSTATNANGGSVTIAAFANGAGTGAVTLAANSSINTSGNGTGSNGNVNIIAGAASGTGATIGHVAALGSSGAANGTVNISTAQPTSSDANPITFDGTGTITSGNTLVPSGTTAGSTVAVSGNVAAARSIALNSSAVSNNGTLTSGSAGVLSAYNSSGTLTVGGTGTWSTSGGPMTLAAQDDVVMTGLFNGTPWPTAGGGSFLVVARGDIIATPASSATINTSSNTGSAGSVVMVAGANFSFTSPGTVVISNVQPSATGGDITLGSGANAINIDTRSFATAGVGGRVGLHAFANVAAGSVGLRPSSIIMTGGEASQANNTNASNGLVFVVGPGGITLGNVTTTTTAALSNYPRTTGTGSVILGGATSIVSGNPVTFINNVPQPGSGNLTAGASQPVNLSVGNITAPGAQAFLFTLGSVATGNIETSGSGAPPRFTALVGDGTGFDGRNGGNIDISAGTAIFTGYLRAYGGGGGGGTTLGGGGCCPAGGAGGFGGTINLFTSGASNITVTGDINSSGGGAGGSVFAAPQFPGAAGAITLSSSGGTISVSGPILAAGGGGGGTGGGGGGSFGGGGGAAGFFQFNPAGGGGGFIGGGGSGSFGSDGVGAGGGGFFGGFGGDPSHDGSAGQGGFGGFGIPGGAFGQAGLGNNPPSGDGANVGTADGGVISISAGNVVLQNTIGSAVGVIPGYTGAGFTNSPFIDDGVNALGPNGSISITETGASGLLIPVGLTTTGNVTLTSMAGSVTNTAVLRGANVSIFGSSGIGLNADINAVATVTLTTNGAGNVTWTSGNITAASLVLSSVSGNFGTTLDRIHGLNISDLTASTTGDVFLTESNPTGLTVFAGTGYDEFNISNNGGDITTTGVLSSSSLSLAATGDGSIILGGSTTAAGTMVLFTSGGAGSVTQSGAFLVNATILQLTAGSGGATLSTNVGSLSASSTGSIVISEANSITLRPSNGSGSVDVTVPAGSNIVVGTLASDTFTADGGITLTTSGIGTISGIGTLASTGQLSLNSGVGTVTVNTAVSSLTFVTDSAVGITQTGDITVNPSTANTGSLTIALTDGSQIFAGSSGAIVANGGIDLIVPDGGRIGLGGGAVWTSTSNLSLDLGTGGVSILSTAVASIDVTGQQIVSVSDADDIQLGTISGAALDFSIVSVGGNISTSSPISGISALSFFDTNGQINLGDNVSTTSSVSFHYSGTGSLNAGGNTVSSNVLFINGGTNATTLDTDVTSAFISSSGSVSLNEADSITLTSLNVSAGTFSVTVGMDGNIDVGTGAGNLTASNGITLTTSGLGTISGPGTLASSAGLSLNAGTGSVTVNTNVASVTFSTNGSVSITEASGLTVNASTAGAGALSIELGSDSNLVIGTVAADQVIANGGITLTTSGTGTMSGLGRLVSAGSLTLNTGGTASVNTDVASVAVNTSTAAVTINEQSALTLDTSNLDGGSLVVNLVNANQSITIGSAGTDTVNADGGITLTVSGNGTISGPGSLTSTGTLTMNAGSGDITVNTNVGTLVISTNSNVTITEAGNILLEAGTTGAGTLTVNAGGRINVGDAGTDDITANGGMTLNSAVDVIGPGRLVSAGNLSLTASGGSNDVNTAVTKVTFSSLGDTTIHETDSIIVDASGSGGTFSIFAAGGGSITIGDAGTDTITGSTGSNYTVSGAGTIFGPGTIGGPVLNLFAGGGAVTVNTNVSSVSMNTSGPVTINELNGLQISTSNISGLLTVNLNPNFGLTIATPSEVRADGGIVFNLSGTGAIGNSGGGRLASNAGLTLTTGTGVVNLNTNVASVTFTTNGNVTINDLNALTVNTSTAGAGSLSLTTGSGFNMVLGAAAGNTITANGGITLNTSGTGTISGPARLVATGNLTVNSGTGSVDVNLNIDSLTLSSNGNVTLFNNVVGSKTFLWNPSSLGAGFVNLLTTQSVTIGSSAADQITSNIGFLLQPVNPATISGPGRFVSPTGSMSLASSGPKTINTEVAILQWGNSGVITVNELDGLTAFGSSASAVTVNVGANSNLVIGQTALSVVQAPSITLTTSGTGTISGPATITTGGTLTINAGSGATNINTAAANLALNTSGNVTVSEVDGLTLLQSNLNSGSLSITLGANAFIVVGTAGGDTITANGGITLTTSGTGAVLCAGTLVSSGLVTLNAGTGGILGRTNAGSLAFTSTGDVLNTEANGVILNPSSTTGALTFIIQAGNLQIGTLATDVVSAGTTASIFTQGTATGTSPGTLSTGGDLSLTAGGATSTIVLRSASPSLTASGAGSVTVTNTGDLQLNAGTVGTLSVSLNTDSDLTIGASGADLIQANNGISLAVSGTGTIGGPGLLVSAGNLSLSGGSGAIFVSTNIGSLTLATNGNVNVNEANSLALNAGSTGAGSLTVVTGFDSNMTIGTAAADVITANGGIALIASGTGTIAGPGTLASTGTLNLIAGTGAVNLITNVAQLQFATSGGVTISQSGNAIVQASTANSFALTVGTGSTVTIGTSAADTISATGISLTTSGTGNIAGPGLLSVPAGTLTLTLGVGSASVNTTVASVVVNGGGAGDASINETDAISFVATSIDSLTITAGGALSTSGNTVVQSDIVLTGTAFNPAHNLTAEVINVTGSTNLPVTPTGSVSLNASIIMNLSATNGTLNFQAGTITLNGITNLNATTSVQAQTGAFVHGTTLVNVNAPTLTISSGAAITGNPLRFAPPTGAGTIANPDGDVVLPKTLVFVGQDLAILALGNITAPGGLASIKLASTAGDGGSLTMIAGFDFLPSGSGQVGPNNTGYSIGNISGTGGSIFLPKTNIDTSSTFAGGVAGNVTLIAGAGGTNDGVISIGSIKASANTTNGLAGRVLIIGENGVQTGAISTNGAIGNAVTISASTPTIRGGTLSISNGSLVGTGLFSGVTPVSNSGAAILINGAINTSATLGRGGDVSLQAAAQVQVNKNILTTGKTVPNPVVFTAGGNVDVVSTDSFISIGAGGINTSGLDNKNAALSINTGGGGSVFLSAPSYINVLGNVITKGGDTKGTGGSGDGGGLFAITSNATANARYIGGIKITGYVDTRAGLVTTGVLGDGGDVALTAGTVQVTGAKTGVSINTTGSTSGDVDIQTFAVQSVPTGFDLTSKTANIVALAGGMFTVQTASPVNGVTGTIVSGANVASKATVGGGTGRLFAGNLPIGTIDLTVTGGSETIPVQGGPAKVVLVADPTTGVRSKVTPAQAMALYEMTRDDSVTTPGVIVNPLGQALSGSQMIVDQRDLNQPFTAFKLLAVDTPTSGVFLSVSGARPLITLPSSAVIGGTLTFLTDGNPAIDFKSGAMNVLAGGQVIASDNSTLMLIGTGGAWNNAGLIRGGAIVIARPASSALTFNLNGSGASIDGPVGSRLILSPDVDLAMSVNFKAKNANFNLPIEFGEVVAPTMYSALASANALNATKLKPVNLTFALIDPSNAVITPVIQGSVSASTISISGLTQKVTTGTAFTPIVISDNTSLVANTTLKISSVSTITVGDFATLRAGVLDPSTSGAGPIPVANILKGGSITILSTGVTGTSGTLGGVDIGNGNLITSSGANVTITANLGDIVIGNTNDFQAQGGRVVVLAMGDVDGGQGNTFLARSTSAASSTAGGIEIGAGLKTSGALNAAFGLAPGFNTTTFLGVGVDTSVNTTGVINAITSGGGSINLATGTPSTFNTTRGAIVFDALNGHTVQFDNATFRTDAVKPIGQSSLEPADEYVVDTDDDDESIRLQRS